MVCCIQVPGYFAVHTVACCHQNAKCPKLGRDAVCGPLRTSMRARAVWGSGGVFGGCAWFRPKIRGGIDSAECRAW
eukprot:685451-Rhodomonas_salina.2